MIQEIDSFERASKETWKGLLRRGGPTSRHLDITTLMAGSMLVVTTSSGFILLLKVRYQGINEPFLVLFEDQDAEPEDIGPVTLGDPALQIGHPIFYNALNHMQLPAEDVGRITEIRMIGNSLREDNR